MVWIGLRFPITKRYWPRQVSLTEEEDTVIPDDQTIGELPATMPFNRLSSKLKNNKTNFYQKHLAGSLLHFDLTLDLLLRNNKAEVLADSRLTTINGREASIKLVDIVPYIQARAE